MLLSPVDTRRIGGLESRQQGQRERGWDTRRIGGLEMSATSDRVPDSDTRRIGGLEMHDLTAFA